MKGAMDAKLRNTIGQRRKSTQNSCRGMVAKDRKGQAPYGQPISPSMNGWKVFNDVEKFSVSHGAKFQEVAYLKIDCNREIDIAHSGLYYEHA